MEPTIGRIVHYKLTRQDATDANRDKVKARENYTRFRDSGVQVHEGNQHKRGDIVPLLVVRVCDNEYNTANKVCRDYIAGDEGEIDWSVPLSTYGVNGQAFLDGSSSLWITSAPQGDFNGAWNWPPQVKADPIFVHPEERTDPKKLTKTRAK